MKEALPPLDQLKSVLCDPEGKCCIAGSAEDRAVVDRALQALAQPPLPVQPQRQLLTDEEIKDCLDAADQMYCERDGDKELFKAHAVLAAHNIGATK